MKKYTQEQIDLIPNILKSEWNEKLIKEANKTKEYLGKLKIIVSDKGDKNSYWITEGFDFVIVQ